MGTKYLIFLEYDGYDKVYERYCHQNEIIDCYENEYKNPDEALERIINRYSNLGYTNIKINRIKEVESEYDALENIFIPRLKSAQGEEDCDPYLNENNL